MGTSVLFKLSTALSARNTKRQTSFSKRKSRRHCQGDDATACSTSDSESSSARTATPRNNATSRPPSPSYYSSNHVLVNRSRAQLGLNGLFRSPFLDEMAREKARQLADEEYLEETPHAVLVQKLNPSQQAATKVGENILRGHSIRAMHKQGVRNPRHMNNMFSRHYNEMGMGTAVCEATGTLYMVQYFRFNPQLQRSQKGMQ